MTLESQITAMLDIDDNSVCLPSILFPICHDCCLLEKYVSHTAATFVLPLVSGGRNGSDEYLPYMI